MLTATLVATALFDAAYVFAPICGFIPQLYTGSISYSPFLSLLTIFANILKLFPSDLMVSHVLLYQFSFCILVHLYLIRTQMKPPKTSGSTGNYNTPFSKTPLHDLIPVFRSAYRFFLFCIFLFVTVLGFLDNMKYTHLFMKSAVIIETAISLLHIKLLERKSTLKLLSFVLLLGDLIKTFLFIVKFDAPKELIVATFIQLMVNTYLTVR